MNRPARLIPVLLLLILPLTGMSQKPLNIDSLKTAVSRASSSKDTVYLDQLKVLVAQLFFQDPPAAMPYAVEHLQVADSLQDEKRLARSYNMLGNLYKTQGNTAKAIQQFVQALRYYEKMGDKLWVANVHSNIGSSYEVEHRFEDALKEQTEALRIRETAGLNDGIDGVLGAIGNIYANLNQHQLALRYYEAAIDTATRQGHKGFIPLYYGNIANVYARLKEYDKSLQANRLSLQGHRQNQDQVSVARVMLNMGLIHNLILNADSAIWYDKTSYSMAKEMGLVPVMQPAAANLMIIYDSLGHPEEAMKWANINLELKDTLANQMLRDEVRDAELKYRMERTEREAAFEETTRAITREADDKRQTIVTASLGGGLILCASLAVVLFVMFRQKRQAGILLETKVEQRTQQLSRSNTQLTSEISEKERAQIELREFIYKSSHDLKGPLSSIRGLVQVASSAPPESPYLPMIRNKVDRLDGVLQQLIDKAELEQHRPQSVLVNIGDLLSELSAILREREGADKVVWHWDLPDHTLVQADPFLLRLALKQVLQNAIDFQDADRPNTITVQLTRNNQDWRLRISDTGTGMTREVLDRAGELFFRGTPGSKGAGLGLYLARRAAKDMKINLTLESTPGKGTDVTLQREV